MFRQSSAKSTKSTTKSPKSKKQQSKHFNNNTKKINPIKQSPNQQQHRSIRSCTIATKSLITKIPTRKLYTHNNPFANTITTTLTPPSSPLKLTPFTITKTDISTKTANLRDFNFSAPQYGSKFFSTISSSKQLRQQQQQQPKQSQHDNFNLSMNNNINKTINNNNMKQNYTQIISPQTNQYRSMSTEKHVEVGVDAPVIQQDTIFGKFARNEIPVPKVYEDDKCFVINDLNPQAKRHMLLIPRKPIQQLSKVEDDDEALLGHLMNVARKVAKSEGLEDGYRLVINNGKEGCQSVYHLHIHILGGAQLTGSFA
jgi:histidine triad (HIT) family protein